MAKFTVISIDSATGNILSDHVDAPSGINAFAVAGASRDPSVEFVVAIPGHLSEDDITFPGDSVVDNQTVIDQPEVFGEATHD
jgi:hypothetical protein